MLDRQNQRSTYRWLVIQTIDDALVLDWFLIRVGVHKLAFSYGLTIAP